MFKEGEKSGLLIIGIAVVLIGFIFAMTKLTAKINPVYLIAVVLFIEFCILPFLIIKRYYEFSELELPNWAFIPFVNELLVMNNGVYYAYAGCLVGIVVLGLLGSPWVMSLLANFLAPAIIVKATFIVVVLIILISVVALFLLRGIAYYQVMAEVNTAFRDYLNVERKTSNVVAIFTFIPIFRVFSLLYLYNDLQKLCMNEITADLEIEEEEEFEED